MANLTEYERQTNFTDAQQADPTAVTSGPGLDAEYNRIKLALDSVIQALNLILRDDGALLNGIVGFDQIDPAVYTGVSPAELWDDGVSYTVNKTVFYDTGEAFNLYRCVESHVSDEDFAVDLGAGKWVLLADYTPPEVLSTIAIADGGTGATSVGAALTNFGFSAFVQGLKTAANSVAFQTAAGGFAVGGFYDDDLQDLAPSVPTFYQLGANVTNSWDDNGVGDVLMVFPRAGGDLRLVGYDSLGGEWHNYRTSGAWNGWYSKPSSVSVVSLVASSLATWADANAFGINQQWQTVSRNGAGQAYQNTTGKPIMVALRATPSGAENLQVSHNNSDWITVDTIPGGSGGTVQTVVPAGHYYRYNGGTGNIVFWSELRATPTP